MFRPVLLSVVLSLIVFINAETDEGKTVYYIEDHCGMMIDIAVQDIVTVRLQRPGTEPRKTCKLQLGFSTSANQTLVVSISTMNITESNNSGFCNMHFLQMNGLQDNEKDVRRLCGRHEGVMLKSTTKEHTQVDKYIYYNRNAPLMEGHHIEMKVFPMVQAESYGCPAIFSEDAFKCSMDNLCIPNSLRCDKTPNCEDHSDELHCPENGTNQQNSDKGNSVETSSAVETTTRVESVGQEGSIVPSTRGNYRPHIIVGITGGILVIAMVAIIALFAVQRHRRNSHEFKPVSTEEKLDENRNAPRATAEDIDTTEQQTTSQPIDSAV